MVDAQGRAPHHPFWHGEAPARRRAERGGRPIRLVVERGIVDDDLARAVDRDGRHRRGRNETPPSSPTSPRRGPCWVMPTRTTCSSGSSTTPAACRWCVHSPLGGRLNRALGYALRKKFCAASTSLPGQRQRRRIVVGARLRRARRAVEEGRVGPGALPLRRLHRAVAPRPRDPHRPALRCSSTMARPSIAARTWCRSDVAPRPRSRMGRVTQEAIDRVRTEIERLHHTRRSSPPAGHPAAEPLPAGVGRAGPRRSMPAAGWRRSPATTGRCRCTPPRRRRPCGRWSRASTSRAPPPNRRPHRRCGATGGRVPGHPRRPRRAHGRRWFVTVGLAMLEAEGFAIQGRCSERAVDAKPDARHRVVEPSPSSRVTRLLAHATAAERGAGQRRAAHALPAAVAARHRRRPAPRRRRPGPRDRTARATRPRSAWEPLVLAHHVRDYDPRGSIGFATRARSPGCACGPRHPTTPIDAWPVQGWGHFLPRLVDYTRPRSGCRRDHGRR